MPVGPPRLAGAISEFPTANVQLQSADCFIIIPATTVMADEQTDSIDSFSAIADVERWCLEGHPFETDLRRVTEAVSKLGARTRVAE